MLRKVHFNTTLFKGSLILLLPLNATITKIATIFAL